MLASMTAAARVWLHARVLWELVRYDLLSACRGLKGVRPKRGPCTSAHPERSGELESAICEALRSVAPFYYKPLRCLQRSIVTARLMRAHGIPAEVVIGYRARPFFSHAWVEVGGRVANDSPRYQTTLQVLERF
jgi:hypothetical protein